MARTTHNDPHHHLVKSSQVRFELQLEGVQTERISLPQRDGEQTSLKAQSYKGPLEAGTTPRRLSGLTASGVSVI